MPQKNELPKKNEPKKKKLTMKERKFVKLKIQGKTNIEAYNSAYTPQKSDVARVAGSVVGSRPHVQQAIEDALEAKGMTPEWAVAQLKKVAEQDVELGAKRLAAKDALELMGWNKSQKPQVTLEVKSDFFEGRRTEDRTVIDVDTSSEEA